MMMLPGGWGHAICPLIPSSCGWKSAGSTELPRAVPQPLLATPPAALTLHKLTAVGAALLLGTEMDEGSAFDVGEVGDLNVLKGWDEDFCLLKQALVRSALISALQIPH